MMLKEIPKSGHTNDKPKKPKPKVGGLPPKPRVIPARQRPIRKPKK